MKMLQIMKLNCFVVLLMMFCTFSVSAQEANTTEKVKIREIPVYRDVDVLASYRGGYEVVLNQIEKATKNCKRGMIKAKEAIIVIDVLVTDKGKVAKVEVVKQTTDLCINDIIKTVEATTQWIPGRIDNKPVNSYIQLTVNLNGYADTRTNRTSQMH